MRECWFPLPDMYRTFTNPETLKRFAIAYMIRNFPGWKPIKINDFRVLAERSDDSDVQPGKGSTKA